MLSNEALNRWHDAARTFSIAADSSEEAIRKRYQHWKVMHQSSERNPLRLA
jgi:hypothetical protein